MPKFPHGTRVFHRVLKKFGSVVVDGRLDADATSIFVSFDGESDMREVSQACLEREENVILFNDFHSLTEEVVAGDDPERVKRMRELVREIADHCYGRNREECAKHARGLAANLVELADAVHPESAEE